MNWVKRPGGDPAAVLYSGPGGAEGGPNGMMNRFSVGDGEPVDLADFAEGLLKETAEEIARLIQGAKRGELGEVRAIGTQVKELRAVFQLVQEERSRIEKLRKHVAGLVGAGELDFQSARDEIGSRLARLRDGGEG